MTAPPPSSSPPGWGTRTKAEVIADYRRAKAERGECRDCKRPVKVLYNGRRLKVCDVHAAADAARKKPRP